MYKPKFYFLALLCCVLSGVALAQIKLQGGGDEDTRASIAAHHERRREHIKVMLVEAKQKVADHESGTQVLKDDEEYETLKKRIDLYARKIEQMEGPMSKKDIDRAVKMRQERHRHLNVEL